MRPLLLIAAVLAGCTTIPPDVNGLRIGALRIVPPAPGQCVGSIEATVVNEGARESGVYSLHVDEGGVSSGSMDRMWAEGSITTAFVTFGSDRPAKRIAPGESQVVQVSMVRADARTGGRVTIRGQVDVETGPGMPRRLATERVTIDLTDWPTPEPLTADSLSRAESQGHELHVVLSEAALPGGGVLFLALRPDGRILGEGTRRLSGEPGSYYVRREAALADEQRMALRNALRSAPFTAFSADPGYLDMYDGHPVRLLVVAGPAAFVGGSQEEDFTKAGLDPILEALRALYLELPVVAKTDR